MAVGEKQVNGSFLQRADQFVRDNIYGVRIGVLSAEAVVGAAAAPIFGMPPVFGAIIGGNAAVLGIEVDALIRRALRMPVGCESIKPMFRSDSNDS